MIFASQGPSFRKRFLSQQSLYPLKISVSAVEVGFEDDFWNTKDLVFVKGFSVSSSLCAKKFQRQP